MSDLPLQLPYQDDSVYSAFHLYVILLNDSRNHKKVFDGLRKRDIGVNLHYIPVYRHPYYSKTITSYDEYPESEKYYSSAISIPLYPSMSESYQDEVIDVIKDLV